VGEFCVAECINKNGQVIVIIAVYISPNQKVNGIIHFIKHSLLPYTRDRKDQLPLMLSGDFNVNFGTMLHFFRNKLNLIMNNDPMTPTTKSGTTIYVIFTR